MSERDDVDVNDPELDAFIEAAEGDGQEQEELERVAVDNDRVKRMQAALAKTVNQTSREMHAENDSPLFIESLIAVGNIFIEITDKMLSRLPQPLFELNREQVWKLMDAIEQCIEQIPPALTEDSPVVSEKVN